jgi:hypothetical protein
MTCPGTSREACVRALRELIDEERAALDRFRGSSFSEETC